MRKNILQLKTINILRFLVASSRSKNLVDFTVSSSPKDYKFSEILESLESDYLRGDST